MNSITYSSNCYSGENAVLLNDTQSYIIQITFFVSTITTAIPNSLQVAIIMKTLQFKVNSTKLALHLSLCDLCLVVCLLPQTYMMRNKMPCFCQFIIDIIRRIFLFVSKCLVVLLTYDRYLHVKSPNHYSQLLATKKSRLLELLGFIAAAFLTALSYINYSIMRLRLPFLIMASAFIMMIIITYYYVKSIEILNEHRLRRTAMTQSDKDISKYAKYILLIFVCSHFTSFGIMEINRATNTRYKYFLTFLHQPALMHYSAIKAICFVFLSSPEWVSNIWKVYKEDILKPPP